MSVFRGSDDKQIFYVTFYIFCNNFLFNFYISSVQSVIGLVLLFKPVINNSGGLKKY